MTERTGALAAWWPSTQALDLVEAAVESVGNALEAEIARYAPGEPIARVLRRVSDLDAAFLLARDFRLRLPRRSHDAAATRSFGRPEVLVGNHLSGRMRRI